jgi:hypothetical protein
MAREPARDRSYRTGFARLRSSLSLMSQATTPDVEIALQRLSVDKLRWLRQGGRDFEVPTGDLLREMGAAYVSGLQSLARGTSRDAGLPWRLASEVYRDRVAARLATGGGDVRARMTPLSPAYAARKGHSRIGYLTGKLLGDVITSKITVRLSR